MTNIKDRTLDQSTNLPKLTVIMPFFNCENYLRQSVTSILKQSFSDFEFIIINDASSDQSDAIMQEFLTDPRIRYFKNEQNQKIVKNLNFALQIAKTELIARMDGDDIACIDRLEKQYNFMISHPEIAVVGSYVKMIDEHGEITGERIKFIDSQKIKDEFLIQSSLVHPAVMYRKSVVESVGNYRDKYLFTEDLDLWYRIVYSGYLITNIPEYLLFYREHSNSTAHLNRSKVLNQLKCRLEIINQKKLKLRLKDYFFILLHFVLGFLLAGAVKQQLEGLYNKLFTKN